MAAALDVEPGELVFTSGGTEADALGVLGAARAARGRHLVVSALEHPAVMRCAEALAGDGLRRWTSSRPAPDGVVSADAVAAAVRRRHRGRRGDAGEQRARHACSPSPTSPACSGRRATASAPTCTSTPCRRSAWRACGRARWAPTASPLSAHKLHGPRGAGALWLRPGARVAPLWVGGGQERGLRGGSENLPALVGFGVAARAGARRASRPASRTRVAALRDRFEQAALGALAAVVPGVRPTVTGAPRAPHIASLAFPGLPAEPLLHALEARGVLASAGSACASRTAGPSPTLKAIGVDDRTAVLRFSLSRRHAGRRRRRRRGRPRAAPRASCARAAGPDAPRR